jgi:hypothetical protein
MELYLHTLILHTSSWRSIKHHGQLHLYLTSYNDSPWTSQGFCSMEALAAEDIIWVWKYDWLIMQPELGMTGHSLFIWRYSGVCLRESSRTFGNDSCAPSEIWTGHMPCFHKSVSLPQFKIDMCVCIYTRINAFCLFLCLARFCLLRLVYGVELHHQHWVLN